VVKKLLNNERVYAKKNKIDAHGAIKGKKGNSSVNIDFYYEIVNHVGVRLYVSLM
jgi:hypothetical protein